VHNRTVTVSSGHIKRFCFLFHICLPFSLCFFLCSRQHWLLSAFERTLNYWYSVSFHVVFQVEFNSMLYKYCNDMCQMIMFKNPNRTSRCRIRRGKRRMLRSYLTLVFTSSQEKHRSSLPQRGTKWSPGPKTKTILVHFVPEKPHIVIWCVIKLLM